MAKDNGDFSAFCNYLRERRQDAGLSQLDVAKAVGYRTSQFISNWERGLALPPVDVLRRLARLFKVQEEDMLKRYLKIMEVRLRKEFFGK